LAIAEAMAGAAAKFGLEGRRLVLDIRAQGADVTQLPEDPARVGPPT
jgi:hypothetical protein